MIVAVFPDGLKFGTQIGKYKFCLELNCNSFWQDCAYGQVCLLQYQVAVRSAAQGTFQRTPVRG
jgi:hypothetical protein